MYKDNYFDTVMIEESEYIALEPLIERITDRFDCISEIYVAHLVSASDVSQLHITVNTGEVDSFEEYLDVATVDKVVVDVGSEEPLLLPFEVMATIDGAGHMQGAEGTTVYMNENVIGAKSRELDTGLTILQEKLAGVCPTCNEEVETFRDHYRDSSECRKQEQV